MLALAVGVLALLGWHTDRRWCLLVAGFIVWAVADTGYLFRTAEGAYLEGTWIDAGWPTAYLLIAVASWTPSATPVSRAKPGLGSFVAPVMCAVACARGVGFRIRGSPTGLARRCDADRGRRPIRCHLPRCQLHGTTPPARDDRRAHRAAQPSGARHRAHGSIVRAHAQVNGHSRSRLGLVLLDVDQFGEINGSLGSPVGDELLRRIANRLSETIRPEDLLARTGADEFAVLLTGGIDLTTARAQAGCLIEALRAPMALNHITVRADVRVAIALCPDHCTRPEQLLSRAEATVRHASAAVGRIAVYHAGVDLPTLSGTRLVNELRSAMHTDELTCHYQPKISARDEQVHSVEALVRWQHPTRGLLLPDQFLPTAEQAGLMRPMTTRVLDIALAQIRSWRDEGITLTLAVNLSHNEPARSRLGRHRRAGCYPAIRYPPSPSFSRSPRARSRPIHSGPTTPSLRCGISESGSRSTITAPVGHPSRGYRIFLWTSSSSTESSSRGWLATHDPSRSYGRRWHSRTASEPTSSLRASKIWTPSRPSVNTAAISPRATYTARRYPPRYSSNGCDHQTRADADELASNFATPLR